MEIHFISNKIQLCAKRNIPKCGIRDKCNTKYKARLDAKWLGKIKKKQRIWNKYNQSKDSEVYKESCRARNQVRKLTKQARRLKENGVAENSERPPPQTSVIMLPIRLKLSEVYLT